jgi:hypothetical protein
MKAILLSFVAGVMLISVVTARFRFAPTRDRVAAMMQMFFLILSMLVAAFLMTPDNLGFLPDALTLRVVWADLMFSLFLYASGFFGGVLQLYNLADRGFSLRILIDILESRAGNMRLEDVMPGYSAGQGINWMYDKRITGMVQTGLISLEGDRMVLTPKGARAASVFAWLQNFFRVPQADTPDAQ